MLDSSNGFEALLLVLSLRALLKRGLFDPLKIGS